MMPQHVAIVMDGNGRWAEAQGKPRVEGHKAGVEAVKDVLQACLEKKIPILSVFAFSSENWTRPKDEINFLMSLFAQALEKEVESLHEHGIKIRFIGERTQLSADLCAQMLNTEKLTENNSALCVNVAINYGGQWDIINATKTLASRVEKGEMSVDDIDENTFAAALSTYAYPNPDLLIRTSGEKRISNFFLWQFSYTELYFCDAFWPDFNKLEFENALEFFASRDRRYGQITKKSQDYV